MAKYLFVYHGGGMAESEEERNEAMARWGAWAQELGSHVIDFGAPIGESRTVGDSTAPAARPATASSRRTRSTRPPNWRAAARSSRQAAASRSARRWRCDTALKRGRARDDGS